MGNARYFIIGLRSLLYRHDYPEGDESCREFCIFFSCFSNTSTLKKGRISSKVSVEVLTCELQWKYTFCISVFYPGLGLIPPIRVLKCRAQGHWHVSAHGKPLTCQTSSDDGSWQPLLRCGFSAGLSAHFNATLGPRTPSCHQGSREWCPYHALCMWWRPLLCTATCQSIFSVPHST